MISKATTVEQYLAEAPEGRRQALEAVRQTLLSALPEGYAEGIQSGMIVYFVPHSLYPKGYHCDPRQPLPFMGLANQKNYMSLYFMCLYFDGEMYREFAEKWKCTGRKLDMGKCCVRFKKLEEVALEVVSETVAKLPVSLYVETYESVRRK